MVDYLRLQIEAGAQAVQIFDSWAGILDRTSYRRFALPRREAPDRSRCVSDLGVPSIYFLNGAPHLIEAGAGAGADVLGLCWREPLDQVGARISDPTSRCRATSIRTCCSPRPTWCARRAADVLRASPIVPATS